MSNCADTLHLCSLVDCSLREAIASGDPGDTIEIPDGTYTLTLGSELTIDKSLTLNGAGSTNSTIIQAAASSADATHRVFLITGDNNVAAISGVIIRHGKTVSGGAGPENAGTRSAASEAIITGGAADYLGGGIRNNSMLTLADSTVGMNLADSGGGIFNEGTLNVDNSTVSNNTAVGLGGGIKNPGVLTVNNSNINENSAGGDGGGIFNFGSGGSSGPTAETTPGVPGTAHINDSTVSNNISGSFGGGISNSGGVVYVTSTTVSGNNAANDGGGIDNFHGTADLTSTTISGNSANNGGGISNFSATLSMINTISAGNTAPTAPDCTGTLVSLGHNLIGNTAGCGFTAGAPEAAGDLLDVNPKLGSLKYNGGPTKTHALLPGSPAIDSSDDSVLGPPHNLTTDQRGAGFPRLRGAHVDIGAYEAAPPSDPPQTSPFTVTKTGDTNDGFCGVADCSLREAIGSGDSGDSINIPIGTYTLTLGTELLINKSLTINGTGSGDSIIQAAASSAAATSRVFNITSGNNVAISDVTIQHGNISASGGGILNNGTLALTNGTVSGNTAFYGGGIFNVGTLTLTNSTVSGNSGSDGAGIYNIGTLTLTNSSVSGNSAGGAAVGGINVNTLTQTNSSVSGDSLPSAPSGGGIWNCNGCTVNFINTMVIIP